VKTRFDTWIDVVTDPNTFVVNIGDLLMRWTNDRWVSNVHRVATPPGNAGATKRLSMAFFHHPNYDAWIHCVASPGQAISAGAVWRIPRSQVPTDAPHGNNHHDCLKSSLSDSDVSTGRFRIKLSFIAW
jgi:isopenicillin N synthase-like dioxygenase